MSSARFFFLLILSLLLLCTGVHALDSKIPKDGTVFVGENDIDISDCHVRTGDEIAFWSSGSPEGAPDSRAKVMDAQHFYVDPTFFSGKTGTWFGLMTKKAVFKVEDPWIQLDIVENGIDHEPEWIKKGNLVSFKISTNMYTLSQRPGSAGVPVKITLTGPNETTYTHLQSPTGTYNLESIFVYYSPFDTGAVWETRDDAEYPEGEYSAQAAIQVNNIGEKNPGEGVTSSLKTTITLSKVYPEKEKEKDKDKNQGKTDNKSSDDEKEESEITKTQTPTPDSTKTPEPTIKPVAELTVDMAPIITASTLQVTAMPTKAPLSSPPKSAKSTQKQPLGVMICIVALGIMLIVSVKNRK